MALAAIFAHDHRFFTDGGQFFSPSSFPESVLRRYVRNFGKVTVICRSREMSDEVHRLNAINTEGGLISFYPVENVRSVSGMYHLPSVYARVKKVLSGHDFVVARLPSAVGLLAVFAARDLKLPIAIEVVGNALEANRLHGSLLGKVAGPVEHALTKYAIRTASHVIYITRKYLQTIYPTNGRAYVCPNVGLCGERFHNVSSLRVGEERMVRIGLIGSLDVRYKGHETAIRVLDALVLRHPSKRFVLEFVGGGDPERLSRVAEKRGLAEQVLFRGSLAPGKAIFDWLESLDVLLQPSQVEAQGRSILEAMSCGCPVVASSVGGIVELLQHEVLAKPDDVDRITEIVGRLLPRGGFYHHQVARNLAVARQYFSDVIELTRDRIFEDFKSNARSLGRRST